MLFWDGQVDRQLVEQLIKWHEPEVDDCIVDVKSSVCTAQPDMHSQLISSWHTTKSAFAVLQEAFLCHPNPFTCIRIYLLAVVKFILYNETVDASTPVHLGFKMKRIWHIRMTCWWFCYQFPNTSLHNCYYIMLRGALWSPESLDRCIVRSHPMCKSSNEHLQFTGSRSLVQ